MLIETGFTSRRQTHETKGTGMTWLEDYWPSRAHSEDTAAAKVVFKGTKITDNVFDLRPRAEQVEDWDVEFVFFHGLLLDQNKLDEAYFRTWMSNSEEDPQCWPATMLTRDFPKARVLSVSYDAAAKKTSTTGRNDMDMVAETLVAELIRNTRPFGASIGQTCTPVVFVTHCLGGLVAQKLILEVDKQIALRDDLKLKTFRDNFGGIVYYSPPFYGSEQFVKATSSIKTKGPLVNFMEFLCKENSRILHSFNQVLNSDRFQPRPTELVLNESDETHRGGFNGQVVEEGASKVGDFLTIKGDHFTVCQPEDETSGSFQHLANFAQDVIGKYHSVPIHRGGSIASGGGSGTLISLTVQLGLSTAVAAIASGGASVPYSTLVESQQTQRHTRNTTSLKDQTVPILSADGPARATSMQEGGAKKSGLAAAGRRNSDMTFFGSYD